MSDTVYTRPHSGSRGGLDIYHTDPDCRRLVTVKPMPRDEADRKGLRCCRECAGDTDPHATRKALIEIGKRGEA